MKNELIFMHIENVDTLSGLYRQSINFSNEYKVSIQLAQWNSYESIYINRVDSIYEEIYSPYIKSINLLEGINGAGKTSILNLIGSTRNKRKTKVYNWRFFLLYVNEDEYIIEGNDYSIIEDMILDNYEKDMTNNEYSLVCTYDATKNKLVFKQFCSSTDSRSSESKILYYRDKSPKIANWIDANNSKEYYEDYNVFLERVDIKPNIYSVYKYIQEEFIENVGEWKNVLANDFKGKLSLDRENDIFFFKGDSESEDFSKKSYMLKFLILYGKYCMDFKAEHNESKEELQNIEKQLSEKVEMQSVDELLSKVYEIYSKMQSIELLDVVNLIGGLDDSLFDSYLKTENSFFRISSDYIEYDVKKTDERIEEIVRKVAKLERIENVIRGSYSLLSAGETKIIDVFASIEAAVDLEGKSYIVLLDEPEKGMHPEMSRKFISYLIKYANRMGIKHNCMFQFVITTHTPFLISDVPKENIHCLRVEYGDDRRRRIFVENSTSGLLSNIPDIMRGTFFLDSPFGEFANKFFKDMVEQIDKMKLVDDCEETRIKKLIDEIDEPTIKAFLLKHYEEKIQINAKDDEMIRYYENQIKKLRNKNDKNK